jgi:hypothetical protein
MIYTLNPLNNQSHWLWGLIDGSTQFLPDGVTKNPTPTYINNATGTVQVLNSARVPQVIGASGATSVLAVYLAASNGDYSFTILSVFNPPIGPGYIIVVDLTAPGGFVGHWEFDAAVKIRKTLAP